MAQPPRNGKPLISFSDEELELLRKHKVPTEPQDEENEEDDDERFIKKDSKEEQKSDIENAAQEAESEGIFKKIKKNIFPKANQQRNLDNEIGGVEEEKDSGKSEDDIWDDRSEEVDKMGSTDVFNSSGMRSVVWKKKKEKLDQKELAKDALSAAATAKSKGQQPKQGFVSKWNVKQDQSDIYNNKGGGGMGR